MPLKTIFAKTGTAAGIPAGEAAVAGLNVNKLPAADGVDAKSLTLFQGMHLDDPLELIFVRNAQDLVFYVEGSMDGSNFSRLAFRTLIDDTVVSGVAGLTLNANARVLIKLPQPGQWNRLVAIRTGCYLAADDATAQAVVRGWSGR